MSSGTKASLSPKLFRDDEILVRECLLGSEQAWSDLIDKYKNLIFSIPIRYGLSAEDAADMFQVVCVSLLQELSRIREPQALAAWLIRSTARTSLRWKRHQLVVTGTPIEEASVCGTEEPPEELMHEIEREQMLHEAIAEASGECARLIHLLFFSAQPLTYEEVARALGFAKGSIGATRMRCLEKLRRSLEKKGFR